MKKAAKVFIWIGMILQFYLVYPIVIGIFALKKIDEAQEKEEIRTWGILTIFLCSILGGVFMLNIKDEDLIGTCKNKLYYEKVKVDTILDEQSVNNDNTANPKCEEAEDDASSSENIVYNIENDFFYKKEYKIGVLSLGIVTLLCFIFSIFEVAFCGSYYYVLIVPLSVCQIILFIFYLMKNKLKLIPVKRKKYIYIINLMLWVLSSMLSISLIIYTCSEDCCVFGWLIFSFSILSVIGSILVIINIFKSINKISILNLSNILKNIKLKKEEKEKTKVKQVKVVRTSKLEIELNEVERLLEIGAITEEEYSQMRKSVISKYYK